MSPRPSALALVLGAACALAAGASPERLRIATFNIEELTAAKLDEVDAAGKGKNPQLLAAAEILRRIRPDILILQEIDVPPVAPSPESHAVNAILFRARYLEGGEGALRLPYAFAAPSNTGELTGLDLNGDGETATAALAGDRRHGDDSFGYGVYPGQYAMAVLSRFPLLAAEVRTFRKFLWRDLPGNHLPTTFYKPEAQAALRLSSKSHWDLPVALGDARLHLWVSHPTPPSFDGAEDKNGRRNHDEIRLWLEYLGGNAALYDDQGGRGGYRAGAPFVIAGDLNANPLPPGGRTDPVYDGRHAIETLLAHPQVQDSGKVCISRGGVDFAQGKSPAGDPAQSTAHFLGGKRVDYLLPSADLKLLGGGVFWPSQAEDPAGHALAEKASDHRLVWIDVEVVLTGN